MSEDGAILAVLRGLIWAALAVVIGYFAYAVAQNAAGAVNFRYWIGHPLRYGAVYWAGAGFVLGSIMGYIKYLERS